MRMKTGLRGGSVAGFYEYGIPSGSIRGQELLDQLSDC
jgi:hypothetical protein